MTLFCAVKNTEFARDFEVKKEKMNFLRKKCLSFGKM